MDLQLEIDAMTTLRPKTHGNRVVEKSAFTNRGRCSIAIGLLIKCPNRRDRTRHNHTLNENRRTVMKSCKIVERTFEFSPEAETQLFLRLAATSVMLQPRSNRRLACHSQPEIPKMRDYFGH